MKTMVCIGDSLTEGTDIPVGHTWPALVSNALSLDVINRGIGGDTTAGMLARFYPEVVATTPAYVFIMGGTNDLWWGWEVRTIVGNLFSMVVQARHHGMAPVIAMPPPVDTAVARGNAFSAPWEGYDRLVEKMKCLCEKLSVHATESEVPLIDLQRPFLNENRQVRSDLFLPDGLHPNRAGHNLIATEIFTDFHRHFRFAGNG